MPSASSNQRGVEKRVPQNMPSSMLLSSSWNSGGRKSITSTKTQQTAKEVHGRVQTRPSFWQRLQVADAPAVPGNGENCQIANTFLFAMDHFIAVEIFDLKLDGVP